MAKHFDTIYADSTTFTNNSMQTNWWLSTPQFVAYDDDTSLDTSPANDRKSSKAPKNGGSGGGRGGGGGVGHDDDEYGIEVAKIAYDQLATCNSTATAKQRESKKTSFYDKIDFLRFPNRSQSQTSTYDHPAGYFHVH